MHPSHPELTTQNSEPRTQNPEPRIPGKRRADLRFSDFLCASLVCIYPYHSAFLKLCGYDCDFLIVAFLLWLFFVR